MASYTLADGTVPHVKGALKAVNHLLTALESHSSSDPSSLLQARLAPDMLPFTFQVAVVCDTAAKLLARLQGVDPAAAAPFDEIKTVADARARVDAALALVESADVAAIAARADETVSFGMGRGKPDAVVKAREYAAGYSLPNLFFHTVTAYAILRKEGVVIGKQDYQQWFLGPYLS
ncbi:hypothetical protein B0T11DRAFT_76869 [Plectosphaerella cucumerina]|uniref:Uncharacterized protein n=1 Tax=Plectosphaerella cucumerina TaxID=40658 RepID=A0A8K0TJT7_9PEZI|nr:hypothetical protein B0T11DRAFT_76869 [Plectosphaerella cucumerina]